MRKQGFKLRRQLLYPTELRARCFWAAAKVLNFPSGVNGAATKSVLQESAKATKEAKRQTEEYAQTRGKRRTDTTGFDQETQFEFGLVGPNAMDR